MYGEILTIRDLRATQMADSSEACVFASFYEIELVQADGPFVGNIWFDLQAFRPLLARPMDISVFTRLLTTSHHEVDA